MCVSPHSASSPFLRQLSTSIDVRAGGHEGVGKGSGEDGGDGVVVQLLSLEAMRSRGSLSEEEFEGAKKLLLREGKASL